MLLSVILFWHCSEEGAIDSEESLIYCESLPEGITSVEVADKSNLLFANAITRLNNFDGGCLKNFGKTEFSDEVAIYTYDNGQTATIFMTEDESTVYFQLIDTNTNEELEFVEVSILYKGTDEVSVLFKSLITDFDLLYDSESNNKGWGSCMKSAMTLLYDDWDNDAGGTFACWVTGPLCAIGGGIACLF